MHHALQATGLLLGGAIIDLDGTFFFQLGIFLVLLFALNKLVFKPVLAVLDAREHATDGAKHEARDLESRAREKLAAFETEMTKAKVELAAERDRMRKDGTALERDLVTKAREEVDRVLSDASSTIERESAIVRGEMKTTVPQLAAQIAEKLLGRKAG